jgi:hypothetical protein
MTVSSSIAPMATTPLTVRPASLAPTPATGGSGSISPPSPGDATILSLSTPGQLMAKMRQLAVTNPLEFKLLAARLGASFQQAASDATGQDAQLLTKVSTQFQVAAQSGQLDTGATGASATGADVVSGAAPVRPARQSVYPYDGGHLYSPDDRAGTSRASWQASAVQQAFAAALGVVDATSGS